MEEARVRLLRDSDLLMCASTTLALVLLLFLSPETPIPVVFVGFAPFYFVFAVAGLLALRGRRRAGAIVLVGGIAALQGGVALFAPGNEAQSLVSILNLVLIAGLTLPMQAMIEVRIAGKAPSSAPCRCCW
jgi:hypothetical protein